MKTPAFAPGLSLRLAAVRVLLLRLTSAAALLATALAGLLTLLVGLLPTLAGLLTLLVGLLPAAAALLTGTIVLIVGLFSAALVLVLILIHLEHSFALRPMCQPALVSLVPIEMIGSRHNVRLDERAGRGSCLSSCNGLMRICTLRTNEVTPRTDQ
jgi:hypothetical protein